MNRQRECIHPQGRLAWVIGAPALVGALAACGGTSQDTPVQEPESSESQEIDDPALERLVTEPGYRDPQVVVDWNEIGVATAAEVDDFRTFLGHRTMPLAHLAIHDALNAIVPVYEPYAYTGTDPEADPTIAVSQAAHDVLVEAYPDHAASLGELLEHYLAAASDQDAAERGVEVGSAAAAAIIEQRADDRWQSDNDYVPGDEPGEYRMTPHPALDEPIGRGWGDTEPLTMASPDQFRPGPPPALSSETYAADFNEVKQLGRKDSEERTEDQTHIGYWFAEYPTVAYPDVAGARILQDDVHLWRAARLFALLAIDNFDGLVSVFDAKYAYNFWRPYHGIRAAEQDGNSETQADRDWEPEMVTAPHPDYPAALSTLCGGGSVVLKEELGNIPFSRESGSAPEGTPAERSYDTIDAAVEDCVMSRIYNGFHFRTGLEVGLDMGEERAHHMLENYLTRQIDSTHPDLADF